MGFFRVANFCCLGWYTALHIPPMFWNMILILTFLFLPISWWTPLDVLGPTDYGGQGRRVLCTPVQGVPMCNTIQPLVPHNFRRGRGCGHTPLNGGGDTNRDRDRSTWSDHHIPGVIFIYQPNRRGYRGKLISLPESLTGSAYGQTRQRRLAWYASHATR